ncbi:MAG: DoxX family protein [bacterium]
MLDKVPLVARILLGLIFMASAIAKLTGAVPPPEGETAQQFMMTLVNTGLMSVIMLVELVGGLALMTGFFSPLALMVLAPVTLVIAWYHLVLDPMGIPVGVLLIALSLAAAHGYRNLYLPIMQPRTSL